MYIMKWSNHTLVALITFFTDFSKIQDLCKTEIFTNNNIIF